MSEDKDSSIVEKLQRQFSEGHMEVRGKDPRNNFTNVNRDIGHMRVHLMANAAVNTQLLLSDPAELEILDTVILMLEHMVSMTMKQQEEIGHFRDLYQYLEKQGARGMKVYSLFCCFFMQAFTCQIFATAANAQGMLPLCQEDLDLYRQQLQLLADIPEDQKRKLFKTLRDINVWPLNLSARKFEKQLDDYLAVIKEDQRRRYEEMNAGHTPQDQSNAAE